MTHDVFISYSSKVKSIADAVCSMLEKEKIRCWIAPRYITPGVSFAEAIIDGIKTSKVFLLIFSSNSNRSQQVSKEVERAVHHGISIIPLRFEDVPMSKQLVFYVSNVHWLDAITPPLENHINKLSKVIKMLLSMTKVEEENIEEIFITEFGTDKTTTLSEKESVFSEQSRQPTTLPFFRKKFFIPLIVFAGFILAGIVAWLTISLPHFEAFEEPVELDPHSLPETLHALGETAPLREERQPVEPVAAKPLVSEPDIAAAPDWPGKKTDTFLSREPTRLFVVVPRASKVRLVKICENLYMFIVCRNILCIY